MAPQSSSEFFFFFLEFKRVVGSPELSDVTEVMICQDIQDTDNVSWNCQITILW